MSPPGLDDFQSFLKWIRHYPEFECEIILNQVTVDMTCHPVTNLDNSIINDKEGKECIRLAVSHNKLVAKWKWTPMLTQYRKIFATFLWLWNQIWHFDHQIATNFNPSVKSMFLSHFYVTALANQLNKEYKS